MEVQSKRKSRITYFLLMIALSLAGFIVPAATAYATLGPETLPRGSGLYWTSPVGEKANDIAVTVGGSFLLEVESLDRVAVSDPDVLDVVVVSDSEVLLNGKSPGRTDLYLWDQGVRNSFSVAVYEDYEFIAGQIRAAIKDPDIEVRLAGNSVILRGKARTREERSNIERVAGSFGYDVINLIPEIPVPANGEEGPPGDAAVSDEPVAAAASEPDPVESVEHALRVAFGSSAGIRVYPVNDLVFLEGTVSGEMEYRKAEAIARAFDFDVVNLLTVVSPVEPEPAQEEKEQLEQPKVPLERQISDAIGDPSIQVSSINDTVLLEGLVEDPFQSERSEAIARAFSGKVVNLIRVKPAADTSVPNPRTVPPPQSASENPEIEIQRIIDRDTITVSRIKDTLLLEGVASSELEKARALAIARAYDMKVVDLLTVEPPEEPESAQEAKAVDESATASLPSEVEESEEPVDWEALVSRIESEISDSRIRVRIINGTVFLEGTVADSFDGDRAGKIAVTFGYPVTNLIRVIPGAEAGNEAGPDGGAAGGGVETSGEAAGEPEIETPQPSLQERVSAAINDADVRTTVVEGTIFLEGSVGTDLRKRRAVEIAKAFRAPVVDLLVVEPQEEEQAPTGLPAVEPVIAETAGRSEVPEKVETPERAETSQRTETLETIERVEALKPAESTEFARVEAEDKQERDLTLEISQAIDVPGVEVREVSGAIVLEGIVSSEYDHQKAAKLASLFTPNIVDLIRVEEPPPEQGPPEVPEKSLAQIVEEDIGIPGVRVTSAGSPNSLILRGQVLRQSDAHRVRIVAGAYSDKVVDLLEVTDPYQVSFTVEVLELDRSKTSGLGIDWGTALMDGSVQSTVTYGETSPGSGIARLTSLTAKIQALVENGDAEILASPTLVAQSGEEARFLAGGEIPIAVPSNEKIEIEWKEYGVKLTMRPVVEPGGRELTVAIEQEVSTLDWTNGVQIGSAVLPGFKTRRTSSTLRVKDGETVALSGLIQAEDSTQIQKLPILGDLPIIGRLFRSEKYLRKETELVFLITPHIKEDNE